MKQITLLLFLTISVYLHAQKDAVGKLSVNMFYNNKEYRDWFLTEYNQYALQEILVEEITPLIGKKQFVVVMGTWCEDSRYEFPRLVKLFDALGIPPKRFQIFGVNKDKTEQVDVVAAYKVTKVPVLLMKDADATEWQTVVTEKPQISWEVDLLSALRKAK